MMFKLQHTVADSKKQEQDETWLIERATLMSMPKQQAEQSLFKQNNH